MGLHILCSPRHSYATRGVMTDGSQWCEASTGPAELANNDITYTLRKACVDAHLLMLCRRYRPDLRCIIHD